MPPPLTSDQKKNWLWLLAALAFAALLVLLGPVLVPFIAAGIVAYALNPAVDWLAARRLGKRLFPRWFAVVFVLMMFAVAALGLSLIALPILQKEIPLLIAKIPALLTRLDEAAGPWLRRHGMDVRLDAAGLQTLLSQHIASNGEETWNTLLSSAKLGGARLLGWLGNLLLIPVIVFYFLLDWHGVVRHMETVVPRRWAGRTARFSHEVNTLLAQYLRGQVAVMLALVLYYSAALTLAGLDIALPVGILTGLLVIIPYLGFGFGLLLALMAALLQFDGWYGVGAVAVVYGLGQALESFVLTPRLVGERIGLHPLAVIFALLAFGQLFGFAGVLLALPASAVLSVAFGRLRTHYLSSTFYIRK